MIRWIVFLAGALGCLGVMVGAYAAHGLEEALLARGVESVDVRERLDQCEVAVRYHMLHSLALLCVGAIASSTCGKKRTLAAVFFLLGIMLFSGGLYSMVFLGVMGHWAIVPSGGLCLMVGWVCVACLGVGKSTTC